MIVNYGYQDGSGVYYITLDTEKCDACGGEAECVKACPSGVWELIIDPYEIMEEKRVAAVTEAKRNDIKYACAPCKPTSGRKELPCVAACKAGAVSHSW